MCKTEVPVRAGVSHKIETENRPTNVRESIVGGADGMLTVEVSNLEMLEEVSAKNLSGLQLQHPFDERTVPVLLGDHVTTENGTGSVHTAPAHGHEDFQIGKENDLDLKKVGKKINQHLRRSCENRR